MQNILNWIEAHPGLAGYLQAVFSVLAILVAAWVPWRIHDREITEQRSVRKEYGRLLIDALRHLKSSTEDLVRLQQTYPVDLPPEQRPDASEFGPILVRTMHAMIEADAVLQSFSDASKMGSVRSVIEVLKVRRTLDAVLPMIQQEIGILEGFMTSGTIRVNVDKLRKPTATLNNQLEQSISTLSRVQG